MVHVKPSGDLARKHPWDRNPSIPSTYWSGNVGNHSVTERWSYTVPAEKLFYNTLVFMKIGGNSVLSGRAVIQLDMDTGAGWELYAAQTHWDAIYTVELTVACPFYLKAGMKIRCITSNTTGLTLWMFARSLGAEFDL